jgi:Ohr subfamily peroxiredoxin
MGTNPEQLLAAGWSVCLESAIGLAARARGVEPPSGLAIDAEVDLILEKGVYLLGARLNVLLPGLAKELARDLVDEAHTRCPFSGAVHGRVELATTVTV